MNDGKVLKSEVIRIIENRIREIHMNTTEEKEAIPQLYKLVDQVAKMPIQEAKWVKRSDGALQCTHCGFSVFNGTGIFMEYCKGCGYQMKR